MGRTVFGAGSYEEPVYTKEQAKRLVWEAWKFIYWKNACTTEEERHNFDFSTIKAEEFEPWCKQNGL